LLLLNRTDQGKSRPVGCIGGPKTGLTRINNIHVFPEKGWILVAQDGMEAKTGRPKPVGEPSFVAVFHITDRGNVRPRWTIGGPNGMLKKPNAIALDPEHKTVIITDKYLNAILTYSLPELFE
jgi:sugar lactone lactonase YvrE